MSVLNSTVLERAWLSGSNDFQQRINNPSVNSYSSVIEQLFAPMNNDLFNEFCGLLNGINATYVDIKRFENPLAILKKTDRDWRFGFSERHLAVHFMKGHSPNFSDETLLKVERPEFEEWYFSLNYEQRYEFSWSRYEIAQAFATDGYGYDDLLSATITQMMSSANYDEMNTMLQVFAEADKRTDGLYRYNISAFPTTEATAKELLKGIRAVAGRMKFPSMLYNHLPVPVHSDGTRLVLYVLPETLASLDVDALSAVFQLSYARPDGESGPAYRIIEVPEFPIPNVCAVLADESFIFWRDYMTGLEPPFYNPGNRTMKYYYYESAAVGFNPAAPVCCFTTEASTTVPTVTMAPSGIQFSPDTGNVAPGGTLQLNINLTGSVTNDSEGKIGIEPDSAFFNIVASRTDGGDTVAVELNSRTYVDKYGVLHVQKSGLETGDVLTITAKATYINPSGTTNTYTDTFTATII